MTAFDRHSVISGIGQSAIGRRLDRTGVDLTIEAAREAVADAGLTFADIDGLATYPGVTVVLGIGYVLVNTLVDVLHVVADPRISL